jgi:hypothetical protein
MGVRRDSGTMPGRALIGCEGGHHPPSCKANKPMAGNVGGGDDDFLSRAAPIPSIRTYKIGTGSPTAMGDPIARFAESPGALARRYPLQSPPLFTPRLWYSPPGRLAVSSAGARDRAVRPDPRPPASAVPRERARCCPIQLDIGRELTAMAVRAPVVKDARHAPRCILG